MTAILLRFAQKNRVFSARTWLTPTVTESNAFRTCHKSLSQELLDFRLLVPKSINHTVANCASPTLIELPIPQRKHHEPFVLEAFIRSSGYPKTGNTPVSLYKTAPAVTGSAMAPSNSPGLLSNKRKRDSTDHTDGGRSMKPPTNGDVSADDEINLQLLQGLDQEDLREDDTNTRTAQAALATPLQHSTYPPPESSFDSATGMPHGMTSFDDSSNSPPTGFSAITPTAQALMAARDATSSTNYNKPAVGTAQWHQQRKDNHKEVERRRRETINEGINELAKVVPGVEKNKGAILQAAVDYIGQILLKEQSWQSERATFDIAIKELVNRCDKMKENAEKSWAEAAKWQRRCRDARLPFDDYDDGALQGLGGVGDDDDRLDV